MLKKVVYELIQIIDLMNVLNMPILNLLNESYETRATDQNQAKLVNMYLEADMDKGKYEDANKSKQVVVAYPMPGLSLFSATNQGVIRAMYSLNEVVYCVAGNQFGSVSSNGTYTQIGTLNTSTGWAKIRAITGAADNNNQIVIVDGTNMYTYNVGKNTFGSPINTTFIQSIQVENGGTNYVSPTITITDSTGTGASATAVLSGGVIASVTVDSGGGNYSDNPVLTITDTQGSGGQIAATVGVSECPQTADEIENQDDYILAKLPDSMQFVVSNLSDTTIWDPLNFASKFSQPDRIKAILSHERMIWLMGDKTSEIWSNIGSSLFPFQEIATTFLHYGVAAKDSIVTNGNYFVFLSQNRGGGYSLFQTLPRIYYYNPAPISNPTIDYQIKSFSTVSDAFAAIHNWNNHEFYTITFPTGGSSYVYDIPKNQASDQQKGFWYYRQSYVNGQYGRYLENCSCFCYGKHLIGDYNSGNIYYMDDTNYTENGTPILREFVTPYGPTYAGGKRVIFSRLQIDVETGIGNNMVFTIEKSTDNGTTWQTIGTPTVPAKGGRIYFDRLGSSRYGMLFRVTTTMNAKFCILGFQVDAQQCHS